MSGRTMTSRERTYQSKPQMVAGAFGVVAFFFIGASAVAFGSVAQKLAYGVICLLACVGLYRYAQSSLRMGEGGIRVGNPWSRYELRWEEVSRFEIGRWRFNPAMCLIHLRDGQVKPVVGIAESNFSAGSAQAMVDELNDELGQHVSRPVRGVQAELFGTRT